MSDPLVIRETETALVITWDRETGEFTAHFSGPALHVTSARALLEAVLEQLESNADEEGIIRGDKEEIESPPGKHETN